MHAVSFSVLPSAQLDAAVKNAAVDAASAQKVAKDLQSKVRPPICRERKCSLPQR